MRNRSGQQNKIISPGQSTPDVLDGLQNAAVTGGLFETVGRYGSAGAEYLKASTGIDQETGQPFDRSLRGVQSYKINPEFEAQNIKQHAGYAAEIRSVAQKNAEAIINGEKPRFARSEDVPGFGKNHPSVDIVEVCDGKVVSTTQTKFVSDPEGLVRKIACGRGGGKDDLSRYLQVDRIDVPTEQVERLKACCREKAESLSQQAARLRKDGKLDLAALKEQQAENCRKLEGKISDAGMTIEEAIQAVKDPDSIIQRDILKNSHKAGIEAAKTGAMIGGAISLVIHGIRAISDYQKNKDAEVFMDAAQSVALDTLKATGMGYVTGFTGSYIKTYMQQSGKATIRALSKTGLPSAIASTCLSMGKSIHRYIKGEINNEALAHEMGLTISGTLSASMFTMAGQILVPIPVLGGLIGGMVGYAITNHFYHGFIAALKDAKLSAQRRAEIEAECAIAIELSQKYEIGFKTLFAEKVSQLDNESMALFALFENPNTSADDFCAGMNHFANILGKKLSIQSMSEFEEMMNSDDPLVI